MNHSTGKDSIETLFSDLRRSEPSLPDAGFTAAVMAQLPKERPALAPWKKNALLVIFTLIGCGLAASIIPQGDAGGAEIIRNFAILLTDLKNFAVAGVAVLMLSVSVIWSIERGF